MSIQFALPHLFQFGAPAVEDHAELDTEATVASLDDNELYGEEEGIRVLYQQSFFE